MKEKKQLRIRILFGEEIAMGPGKLSLLRAILGTGSISAAARQMSMSYRRAWLLVDTMNHCFQFDMSSYNLLKTGCSGL